MVNRRDLEGNINDLFAYLKVLYHKLPEGNEKTHTDPLSRQQVA
jgi:hypothetical protein